MNRLKHLGVILDGNRRFAKKLLMQPWKGHDWGAKKVRELLEWCKEQDIKELTLYAFSEENFNRPKKEFDYLMDLFIREFDSMATGQGIKELKKTGIRIKFIGRINKFDEEITSRMNKLMDLTKDFDKYKLNIAMAYGGRQELVDAFQKIGKKLEAKEITIKDINEELINKNLYLNSEPDIIIRTGGENRTSNFLIWQSSYSEWLFVDKPWPEFEKADFIECLKNYSVRERRFGK